MIVRGDNMKKDERTKQLVAHALIKILDKHPLDLITIKEICKQAGVGRTAFYHHFKNKEDVLKYIYRKAHYQVFQDKFKDLDYLCSDSLIKDMIYFFDTNSDLLLVLYKWHLIDMIARYNTEMSLKYIEQCNDEFIRHHADYFMCYSGSLIFNICSLWVLNHKDLSKEALFEMIKYFNSKGILS